MPSGVPMAWMRGFVHHMPVCVESGYCAPAVVEAVARRMRDGARFLLPVEDAVRVSEELGRRFGPSHWQYTLSSSSANAEAIRLARMATGREGGPMFDGSHHGHIGETLVDYAHETPRSHALGLPRDHARDTTATPFNDPEAAEAVLARGDTACAMVEPAPTDVGLVLPRDGFLEGPREACDRHGALMIADEAHTHMFAYGGLMRLWGLGPHIVTVGKNVAGGVPIGAYGFGEDLARPMDDNLFDHAGDEPGFASSGTLYGGALSMAAARATLEHVLTEEAYRRASRLGGRLARGVQDLIDARGPPWRALRLESRSGWRHGVEEPASGADAVRAMDVELSGSRRIFMANRGVWEAVVSAGPSVSFPMTDADIDLYLELSEAWPDALP